jgi:hypothetical protein
MRDNLHCPRCHDDGVRRVPGGRPYGSAAVTRYECPRCEYAEEWVESSEDLTALRRALGLADSPEPVVLKKARDGRTPRTE